MRGWTGGMSGRVIGLCLLVGGWLVGGCRGPAAGVGIGARLRPEDRITLVPVADGVRIDVVSPFGIGWVRLDRQAPDWPARLVIRLHLAELEGITVSDGVTTWEGSRKWEGPLHCVRVGDAIEVNLPDGCPAPAATTLRIHWVDYYR